MLIIPPTLLVSVFREASKTERNCVGPLMHKTPATGSRVFDFHCVCAKSEKSTRTVTRFVQVHCVCLNQSRILFGEETRTHVCGAVCAVRSTRNLICD